MGARLFSGLRARLLAVGLVAALPGIAVMGYGEVAHRRFVSRHAAEHAVRIAETVATAHAESIKAARQLLGVLSRLPDLTQWNDPERCSRLLRRLLEERGPFINLGVIDAGGRAVCSGLPMDEDVLLADRGYFRRALERGGFAAGDYQIGRITGRPSVNFGMPIRGADDEARGVVFVALGLDWFARLAASLQLPAGSEVTVLDRDGVVLSHYPDDGGRWVGRSAGGTEVLTRLAAAVSPEPIEAPGLDGVRRLYAAPTLETEGGELRLLVGLSREALLAPAAEVTLRALFLVLIVTGVVTLIAWWTGEVLVLRPIRALGEGLRRIADGELNVRVPAQGRALPELARVAETFDTMAAALRERDAQVQDGLARVQRLNRVRAMLTAINGAILRIRNRQRLLDEVCRIAVEVGGLRVAAIMLRDPGGGAVRLAAHAGVGREHFEALTLGTDAGDPRAYGPMGSALRQGRPVAINDFEADQRLVVFTETSRALGVRAGAGLPLYVNRELVGVLGLYAEEVGSFDAEEVAVLEELAADTGLGLELIDKEERIEQLAFFDLVTGLPNRRLFQDRIGQAIARRAYLDRVTAVIAMSIDNFRRINDLAGHRVGDALLRRVGEALERHVRSGDTVARIGSNDFGIVLTDVADQSDVGGVLEKLRACLPKRLTVNGAEVFPLYKFGVARYPQDGADAGALIRRADLALEAAERSEGMELAYYSIDLNVDAQRTGAIEGALNRALEREELYPVFQPIVALADGALIAVETLLRWDSAALGPVPPSEFIPVAEETGLIVPIGDWLLARVCAEAREWSAAGLRNLRVGINLSAVQLRDGTLVERTAAIMNACDCAGCGIELYFEVTESKLMENRSAAMARLAELAALGVKIAIDDFGTGFSSLSYLHQLPAAVVKIDRSFVARLQKSSQARVMVKGIIGMAKGLGLQVVAEGVETEEELKILRALGCDAAQGYYICVPVRGAEILARYGSAGDGGG